MATDFTTQINAPFQAVAGQNDPSAGDVATLNAELNSGTTLAQADVQIVNEPFFTTDVDPVVRLYQAAFGRVPDAAGLKAEVQALIAAGGNVSAIASAFANSSEFLSRYGAVATTPENPALVLALYTNVLGRAPDAAGLAFWDAQTQLNAAQLLVDFSQSSEFQTDTNAYVKSYEFDVAANSNNGGAAAPATGSLFAVPLNAGNTGGAPTTNVFTLTPGVDSFTTGTGGDTYNGLVFFNVPSGTFFDTLNTGDTIQTTGAGNVLNASFATVGIVAGNPGGPPLNGVIVQGVQTWNLSSTAAPIVIDAVGATANITGLTTLNVSNSGAGSNIQLGAANNGIGSLPATIGLTNDVNVTTVFVAAASLASGSSLAVAASGVGALGADAYLNIGPDSGAATGGYATWNINLTGTDFLAAGALGFTGDKTLNVAGSGSGQIDGDSAAPVAFSKTTTISLASETGNVFITGASANANAAGYTDNAAAGASGLLNGNTVLTSYTGGSGNDIVDLSSMTAAQLQAMTKLNGGTGTSETLIVSQGVSGSATGTVLPTTGFTTLGIGTGAGAGAALDTVNMTNFAGMNGVTLYSGTGAGALQGITINNAANNFTFNWQDAITLNVAGGVVINGVAGASTVNLVVGQAAYFETAAAVNAQNNDWATNGFGVVNLSSVGPAGGTNLMSNAVITASAGSAAALNISGSDGLTLSANSTPSGPLAVNLIGNGTSITDTDTGKLTLISTNGTAFSTDAAAINAGTSGGLFMIGGDSATIGTAGDVITGSATKANVLAGSVGNDVFTGSTAGGDGVWTNGGGDTINLGAAHAAADTIFVVGVSNPAGANAAVAGSINNAGVTQAGFFGNAPGATGATASTSADQSVVSNFVAGTAATADNVTFSNGAWAASGAAKYDGLLNSNLTTNAGTGNATIVSVASGGTITSTTANLIELTGATFANASALATALNTGSFGLTFAGAGTATHTGDVLLAYQDAAGNTHIADVAITETGVGTEVATGHVSAASDLVQLTGVSLASLAANNVHFIA